MNLRPIREADAGELARVHASAFDQPWTGEEILTFAAGPGGFALAAAAEDGALAGFILCRLIAGEAEVLTLAVGPQHRRRGVARALLEAARALAEPSAGALFLEVAEDNPGAVALYEAAGFERIGRRAGYYGRPAGGAVDALVMRLPLNR